MDYTLINKDFGRSIKTLRKTLPKLAFGLLIGTYAISAIIMGIFHAQGLPNIGFQIAAFLVPFAIQAGRGALVFFFQLNPIHLQSKVSFGIISATALLLLSFWEAYSVMSPYGESWTISVSSLMLIGWIIEIMLLKETQYATQWELFQDQELWQEIKQFYVAKEEMKQLANKETLKTLALAVEKQKEVVIDRNPLIEETTPTISPVVASPNIETFYGVTLDPNNPYLSFNLKRLEKRFVKRYHESLAKDVARRASGKASHQATLKSIANNKARFEQVRTFLHELLGEELDLRMPKKD